MYDTFGTETLVMQFDMDSSIGYCKALLPYITFS